jgi:hypothetical protein
VTVAASKKIRALLATAGYGKADVSVYNKSYSMGSTVYVTIKRAEIPLGAVEKIASEGEEVRRDGRGDILEGGNCFVDTRYAHGLLEDYAAQINAQIGAGRWRFGIFSITNDDRFTLSAWRDAGDGSGSHVLKMDRASPGDGLARLLAREGLLGVLNDAQPEPTVLLTRDEQDAAERALEGACHCSPADAYECLACNRERQAAEPESFAPMFDIKTSGDAVGNAAQTTLYEAFRERAVAPVVSINTPLARANEVAAEMAEPIARAYSLDGGAEGERLAARVVRAAERWQAAFPCPGADEPRLRALWLAVDRLIEHDESESR